MTLVLYLKEGCPFCQRVKDKVAEKNITDTEIYYVGKDFELKDFKDKYGQDATFPRGYEKKDGEIFLIGDSGAIISYIDKNY